MRICLPSSTPSNRYDLGTTETRVSGPGPESGSSLNCHEPVNNQHLPSIHPAPEFHDTFNSEQSTDTPPSTQFHDRVSNDQSSSTISPSPPPYPSAGYPSQDYHHPPPSQDYHPPPKSQGPYPQHNYLQNSLEHPQHLAPNCPSHETPSYSHPHFQSYPSFSESSLPSGTSNCSYYQQSDASYSSQLAPLTTNHSSSAQPNFPSRNGTSSEPNSTTQTYQYDSNYQPPPEKIAEAHKAARYAVGALAFNDVSAASRLLEEII